MTVRLIWMAASFLASAVVAFIAWGNPAPFVAMVDIVASVLAILVGVSLAVFTILAARPRISKDQIPDATQRQNAEKLLEEEDSALVLQQYLLFCLFLAAIAAGILLKFLSLDPPDGSRGMLWFGVISGVFGFLSTLAFLLSVFLPGLAAGLVRQRRQLG